MESTESDGSGVAPHVDRQRVGRRQMERADASARRNTGSNWRHGPARGCRAIIIIEIKIVVAQRAAKECRRSGAAAVDPATSWQRGALAAVAAFLSPTAREPTAQQPLSARALCAAAALSFLVVIMSAHHAKCLAFSLLSRHWSYARTPAPRAIRSQNSRAWLPLRFSCSQLDDWRLESGSRSREQKRESKHLNIFDALAT